MNICDRCTRKTPNKRHALVKQYSFVDVGKMYEVHYTTIKNWCQKLGHQEKVNGRT